MSRYKDHREPRHRGYDEFPPDPGVGAPMSFSHERDMGAPATGPLTQATVKWFNADKGFGFVQAADGSEAFLHIRQLEATGNNSVPEGATLTVRIGRGQKGPQVTEVTAVDTSTATPSAPRMGGMGRGGGMRAPREALGPAEERHGTVKWYNPEKGFGFIAPDGGGKDVFIHASALERSGMTNLAEGQRLVVQVVQGQKGFEAQSVAPLD
jgi:CspA family cold shock protein